MINSLTTFLGTIFDVETGKSSRQTSKLDPDTFLARKRRFSAKIWQGAGRRLFSTAEADPWLGPVPGRPDGSVGGSAAARGACVPLDWAAQKLRVAVVTMRMNFLDVKFLSRTDAPGPGEGGGTRMSEKFAREGIKLAGNGPHARILGGAAAGRREGGRLGGPHLVPACPSHPRRPRASAASDGTRQLAR